MQQKFQSFQKFCKSHLSLIFFLILILMLVIIYFHFLTTEQFFIYTDVGSDTYDQYFPYYIDMASSIKNGTFSAWAAHSGLGTSVLNFNAWTFDPYGLLAVLGGVILGISKIKYLLIFVQILKILTIYYIGIKYFRLKFRRPLTVHLSAFLLAFSGYIILWGQHYFLGTACVFMILMLFCLERLIQYDFKKGHILLTLSTAALLVFSYYIGYMVLLVSAIYFLYRVFTLPNFSFKKSLRPLLNGAVPVLIGVCLASCILLPSAYFVSTNSARLDSSVSLVTRFFDAFTGSFDIHFIARQSSRLMSNNLLVINGDNDALLTNYYEAPQFFTTFFIFFFIIQYIIYIFKQTKKSHRTKGLPKWLPFILNLLLLYIFLFSKVGALIMNGLVKPGYRYTFTIIPLLVLATGYVYEKILIPHKINKPGLYISLIISFVVWLFSIISCVDDVRPYVILVGICLCLGFTLLIFISISPKLAQKCLFIFTALLIFCSGLESWYSTNHRVSFPKINYPPQRVTLDRTSAALDWLKEHDDSFYRVELTYEIHRGYSDSSLISTSGNSWYDSTQNHHVMDFYNNLYTSSAFTPITRLAKISDENDLISLSLTNSRYILSPEPLKIKGLTLLTEIDGVKIYQNEKTDSALHWSDDVISESEASSLTESEKLKFIDQGGIILSDSVDLKTPDTKSHNISADLTAVSSSHYAGTLTTGTDGFVATAIPDISDWQVYIDGEKVDHFTANYGFIGFYLPAGTHTIDLEYHWPLEKPGLIISGVGIILFFGEIIYLHRQKSKN